jgi:hypothetical protein
MGWEARIFFKLAPTSIDLTKLAIKFSGVEERVDLYYIVDDDTGLKSRGGGGLEVKTRLQVQGCCEKWEKRQLPPDHINNYKVLGKVSTHKRRRQVSFCFSIQGISSGSDVGTM